MMKKWCSVLLTAALVLTGVGSLTQTASVSAATSNFTFNGSMSKEVLRSYASRAVSHLGLCVDGLEKDPIFEEDVRMLRRIGAKYIGRAALYSWSGSMSASDIDKHFEIAEEQAEYIHKLDPEMILQAGIFEIAYRGTVNNTKIPAHVFEAFGQPVENRNFRFEDVVYPAGTKDKSGTDTGIGCWGNADSGVPDIHSIETQMYFYYQITRYIDAGYEAFHMGQAEKMMLYEGNGKSGAAAWDKLLTLARTYAEDHARRGIVLFDCHTAIDSGGIMVGNRLVFDIQGAGLVPNETEEKDGALMCEISDYRDCWLQWIGRSAGGQHPLGFTIEENFTILEFDNYGGNGNPGVPTKDAFYNWGYDDVTWFATQPEWYRNQFIKECDAYLKSHVLDSEGKQQYFLQPSCCRVITPEVQDYPTLTYEPSDDYDPDFLFDYAQEENTRLDYHSDSNTYTLTVQKDYRANKQSDDCPNGFSQEDTIREIFLGKNAPEDPKLLPGTIGYGSGSGGDAVSPPPSSQSTPDSDSTPGQTPSPGNEASAPAANVSDNVSGEAAVSGSSSEMTGPDENEEQQEQTSSVDADASVRKKSSLPLILGIVFGVLALLAAGGCAFYFLYYKKKRQGGSE